MKKMILILLIGLGLSVSANAADNNNLKKECENGDGISCSLASPHFKNKKIYFEKLACDFGENLTCGIVGTDLEKKDPKLSYLYFLKGFNQKDHFSSTVLKKLINKRYYEKLKKTDIQLFNENNKRYVRKIKRACRSKKFLKHNKNTCKLFKSFNKYNYDAAILNSVILDKDCMKNAVCKKQTIKAVFCSKTFPVEKNKCKLTTPYFYKLSNGNKVVTSLAVVKRLQQFSRFDSKLDLFDEKGNKGESEYDRIDPSQNVAYTVAIQMYLKGVLEGSSTSVAVPSSANYSTPNLDSKGSASSNSGSSSSGFTPTEFKAPPKTGQLYKAGSFISK